MGQVFSIRDRSGTDLIDGSTHFNIPFLSKRSAASFLRANKPSNVSSNSEFGQLQCLGTLNVERKDNAHDKQAQMPDFQFPFWRLAYSSLVEATAKAAEPIGHKGCK